MKTEERRIKNTKMQRSGNTTAPQVILLLFLGSCACAWARQMTDNYDKMRLFYNYPSGYKRLPSYSYDFGLGKRSLEESSYEEQLSPMDIMYEREQQLQQQGQQGQPGGVGLIYPNTLGKRTRAYGFGLGKRLTENDWKLGGSSSSFTPTYRFALAFFLLFLTLHYPSSICCQCGAYFVKINDTRSSNICWLIHH